MKECYNTQEGTMESLVEDVETSKTITKASVLAAYDMCADKVLTCAALYGDPDGCKIENEKVVSAGTGKTCGLQSLLNLVETLKDVKVYGNCEAALHNYLTETCTPRYDKNAYGYPWACRTREPGSVDPSSYDNPINGTIVAGLVSVAKTECDNPLSEDTKNIISKLLSEYKEDMAYYLRNECENLNSNYVYEDAGLWFSSNIDTNNLKKDFYDHVFAGETKVRPSRPLPAVWLSAT